METCLCGSPCPFCLSSNEKRFTGRVHVAAFARRWGAGRRPLERRRDVKASRNTGTGMLISMHNRQKCTKMKHFASLVSSFVVDVLSVFFFPFKLRRTTERGEKKEKEKNGYKTETRSSSPPSDRVNRSPGRSDGLKRGNKVIERGS